MCHTSHTHSTVDVYSYISLWREIVLYVVNNTMHIFYYIATTMSLANIK